MAQKYIVSVDGKDIQSFQNQKDAEDFRKSVAGSIRNVKVQSEPTMKRVTQ